MAEAKRSTDWDAPSVLWALWAELHRDEKRRSKPFTAADVHPFYEATKEQPRPISEFVREAEQYGDSRD